MNTETSDPRAGSTDIPRPVIRRSQLPPGPPELPIVGQLFRLIRNPIGLMQEGATYGDMVTLARKPALLYLVTHPDLVETLLVTCHQKLRRPRTSEALRYLLGNGMLTADDPLHLRQRRLIQPQFHRRRIEGYAETMVEYALRHERRWKKLPSGTRVDMTLEMHDLMRRVVTKTLFGLDLPEEARRLGEAFEQSNAYMRMRGFQGPVLRRLLHGLPLPATRRFHRDRAYLDGVVYGLIDERRKSQDETDDLLSMMLGLRYEDEDGNDAGAMSDRQVRDEAITMFAAGQGTSTMALAWTWYLLAAHPTVQERFHREVDEALDGRPPTPADLPNLPLTDQIVTESMRLYPPVYTTAQTAAEPFELGGYHIPAGALLTAPQIVVHRDGRWFEEPDAFRPERWTPEFRKSLHRYAYFPYGGGPRLCIGDRFSEMAVRLIMASFGQRWKVRPDPTHAVEMMPFLTLKAKGGLPLFLERRN